MAIGSRPSYDTFGDDGRSVTVKVADGFDDVLDAVAVRSAVFVGEQNCPVREELDGNDFSSTHLIAYVGGAPVGATRVRCFADFAQWGRLAVLPSWRGFKVSTVLAKAAIELIRDKGYRLIYGQAETSLLAFYRKLGFRPLNRGTDIIFSDYHFTEIVMDLNPSGAAVTMESDPYVIIRTEGRWRQEGVLEQSASRGASQSDASIKTSGEAA